MTILVTGAAGFIGFHVCRALLERGETVIGVDNLSPYYAVELKQARLAQIEARDGFTFYQVDIADRDGMRQVADLHPKADRVIHLEAG